MDGWGDLGGRYKWKGKLGEKARPIIQYRYCPQNDSTVCVCVCACACVCAGWMTDEKAQPSASEYVINIITVDRANCNVSEITNPQVTPHIKQSDNCITRVNGHCHCFGNNRDVL